MPLIAWTLFLIGRDGSNIKATRESKEVVQGRVADEKARRCKTSLFSRMMTSPCQLWREEVTKRASRAEGLNAILKSADDDAS
jgi:hypothetical protein